MKKFTFVLVMMLAYAGFTMAQTIENFESIKLDLFAQGSTGAVSVVPNPNVTGINTSVYSGMMVRAKDGDAWQGMYHDFSPSIDVTTNKYLHLKLLKPRKSPIVIKYEANGDPNAATTGDTHPMTPQADSNIWEEFVFDMTAYTGTVLHRLTIIPDFPSVVGLSQDINIYFDDIYLNNDPAVGSAPVTMLEDFEVIPLNYMLNGANDNSSMLLVENPDKTGVNMSGHCIKFLRDKDGSPWDGFWSNIGTYSQPLDLTTNKYVHVKVWKTRITPVFFKIEGGSGVPTFLEKASDAPQTQTGKWEDIVWDFSSMPATTYPIIGLQPDREDPVTLTDDIIMYFDDIVVNNDPNPSVAVTFNVDMHGSKLATNQKVYIAGNITGWAVPDTKPEYEMLDPNADSIYTISLVVPAGDLAFKFFKGGSGWDGGEWAGDPNRTATVTSDAVLSCVWGQLGFVGKPEIAKANKIQMYPNPVRNELTINSTADVSRIIFTNTLGKVVGNITYTGNQTINTSNFSKGMYFVTFVNTDGTKVIQKLIKD